MAYRYTNRTIFINKDESYRKIMKDRGIKQVRQYDTARFRYPTIEEISQLDSIPHVWKAGDRYYKLAYEHYADASLWWLIAWYNKKPIEGDLKLGDVIYIPMPVNLALGFFED
jgi:hypothetical protein